MKNNFCAVFSSSVGKTAFAVGLFALCLNTEAVTTYALIGSRQPVGTDVSYFLRTGKHALLPADWLHYLDRADYVFGK